MSFQLFGPAAVLTPSVYLRNSNAHGLYTLDMNIPWDQKDFLNPHLVLIGIISLIIKSGFV